MTKITSDQYGYVTVTLEAVIRGELCRAREHMKRERSRW
jgi:hypothetical protein